MADRTSDCSKCSATLPKAEELLQSFESDYKDDFPRFCLEKGLVPRLDHLYPYRRLATPYAFPIIHDTQFYLYFCDDKRADDAGQGGDIGVLESDQMVLNLAENTQAVWMCPSEALLKYTEGTMALFPPQIAILTQLLFHKAGYSTLKQLLSHRHRNPLHYLTERAYILKLEKAKTQDLALKQTKMLYNRDYDLELADS